MNHESSLRTETLRFTGTLGTLYPVPLAATVEVYPDVDALPPDQAGDLEPALCLAERREALARHLAQAFGAQPGDASAPSARAWRIAGRLRAGAVVRQRDGTWYYPVARYEHSGIALALTGSRQAAGWPDQRWDVTRLAGWVKVTRALRIAWGIDGARRVQAHTRANVTACLRQWEAYLNGWNVYCAARLVDEETGLELEQAFVAGFTDIDEAVAEGLQHARDWQRRYGADASADTGADDGAGPASRRSAAR